MAVSALGGVAQHGDLAGNGVGDPHPQYVKSAGGTTILPTDTSTVGLTIRQAPAGAVDILNVETADGTDVVWVSEYGELYAIRSIFARSGYDNYVALIARNEGSTATANLVQFQNGSTIVFRVAPKGGIDVYTNDPAQPVIVAKSNPAQTAPFMEFRNSANTLIADVKPDGSSTLKTSGSILALKQHTTTGDTYFVGNTTDITSQTAIDTTNLRLTFTMPASGQVLVTLQGGVSSNGGYYKTEWGLREGTTTVARAFVHNQEAQGGVSYITRVTWEVLITGTAGAVRNLDFVHRSNSSQTYLHYGPTYGAILMKAVSV